MAMAFEVMGISPPASAMVAAEAPNKAESAFNAGKLIVDVLERGLKPSDIITKASLENAIAAVATLRKRPVPSWLDLLAVAVIWLPFDTGPLKGIWA